MEVEEVRFEIVATAYGYYSPDCLRVWTGSRVLDARECCYVPDLAQNGCHQCAGSGLVRMQLDRRIPKLGKPK